MHHQVKKGRRFGRTKEQREAMFNAMAASLFEHGAITTTEARAKELSRVVEPMITRAKDNTVANRRRIARRLAPAAVTQLFTEVAPRYTERPGGYTRIIHLRPRKTDGARMARIELVE